MKPKLIGYFPKRVERWNFSPGSESPGVLEVCSASDCVSQGPAGWRDRAPVNRWDCYDTLQRAWTVVPAGERTEFEVFAYQLYPMQFDHGREESLVDWSEVDPEPLPSDFIRLGWDAVQGGTNSGLGCSPLTCNGQIGIAGVPPVNRYSLLDSLAEAKSLAKAFSISEPEPGPYCVVAVWRKRPGQRS